MYWTRFVRRDDLENGTFVLGAHRVTIGEDKLATFADAADAALAIGVRASEPEGAFDRGVPVWLATLRRRQGDYALLGLQRLDALADAGSLVRVLEDMYRRAGSLGYRRLWLAVAAFRDQRLVPALEKFLEVIEQPLQTVASVGLLSVEITPSAA